MIHLLTAAVIVLVVVGCARYALRRIESMIEAGVKRAYEAGNVAGFAEGYLAGVSRRQVG